MKIFAAPMQGLTEAPWRKLHAEICGAADAYFSPFLRVEKGVVRAKELRDIAPEANAGIELVPQAIFRSADELQLIVDAVLALGYRRLDLNLGCPFPPQVHRGRGAAMVSRPEVMEQVAALAETSGLELSVKMRPGVKSPDEWRAILPVLNAMPLTHVTVHPRLAVHGYSGPLLHECFDEMASEICHPIVYNGDLTHPAMLARYNNIYGVMVGRGLISRPSLIAEWRAGREMEPTERIAVVRQVLTELAQTYAATLCGDKQVLMKLRPYTEYNTTTKDCRHAYSSRCARLSRLRLLCRHCKNCIKNMAHNSKKITNFVPNKK